MFKETAPFTFDIKGDSSMVVKAFAMLDQFTKEVEQLRLRAV